MNCQEYEVKVGDLVEEIDSGDIFEIVGVSVGGCKFDLIDGKSEEFDADVRRNLFNLVK